MWASSKTYSVQQERPKIWALTSHRTRTLCFIRVEIARGNPFPPTVAIAKKLDTSPNLAKQVLDGLMLAGHIRRIGREKTGRRLIIWELIP